MKINAAARSRARHYAMQALYQWEMTGNNLDSIESEYHADNDMSKVDVEYFHMLVSGAAKVKSELDQGYLPYLKNMGLDELDPVTKAILRMSSFEFKDRIDVPYRVVINEAVNLAKKFGAADSHKFVNGVLDKLASDYRKTEINQPSPAK
ncbi:MAG: transcription antitermination factor NusB [Agarilytica sp.]